MGLKGVPALALSILSKAGEVFCFKEGQVGYTLGIPPQALGASQGLKSQIYRIGSAQWYPLLLGV